jgi:hypothetical protein
MSLLVSMPSENMMPASCLFPLINKLTICWATVAASISLLRSRQWPWQRHGQSEFRPTPIWTTFNLSALPCRLD